MTVPVAKRITLVLLSSLVAALVVLPNWWQPAHRLYGRHYFRSSPLAFDAATWRAETFSGADWRPDPAPFFSEPLRYRMSLDIASSGMLIGLDEASIRSHLDSPTQPAVRIGPSQLVYAVAKVDDSTYRFLTIVLDERGAAVRVIAPTPP